MRVPWTERRSNQSILKEINPEYSLEGLMLKLKLQYSGHLMQRVDSLEKTLLLGRKAMTNLDSILKSRDITLLTKVCLAKAMVFPVIVYGRESWTIKKAEHQRTEVLEKTSASPGQLGDQTSQSQRKSTLNIHQKD